MSWPLMPAPDARTRHRRWDRERAVVAELVGVTEPEADDLLDVLPYSAIPDWTDVVRVADWFTAHGWTRPEATP